MKQARREIRKYRAARRAGMETDTNTLLLVLLALLLPPLAVYLHQEDTTTKFWITLLLFLLGLAGAFLFSWLLIFASVVYAIIVILGGV
ncbi:MAG: YqaE/Pmp3 family membrane protein [Chitinophagaceae bacterium]